LLRVLHLTDTWGPGGAETVYADLAAGIGPPEFESIAGLPRASEWLYETVRARGLDPVILPSTGAFDVAHLRRLISTVKKHDIDVLQAHTLGSSVYASLAGCVSRKPVVCTLHGRVDLGFDDRFRSAKFGILGLGRTHVIPVSAALEKELLETTNLRPSRAHVIYNGVDTSRFRPGRNDELRRELDVLPNEILIGAVGNVRRVKGYEVLLGAAAILKETGVPFKIVIVGQATGDVFEEIANQRSRLGLDNHVKFAGFRTDAPDFYRAFDIYALTSHSEGFPLSTLQALASGLPVVATRCGGPQEMLSDGQTGFLAESGSATDVASKLGSLAGNENLRMKVAAAARALAEERYSTRSMLQRYCALYECLSRRPSRVSSGDASSRAQALERETVHI
jgi:glycosyltransferase involved in cell wall biosynthesis